MSIHPHESEPVTLEDLDRRLTRIEARIDGLLDLWETATGVLRVIKLLAAFVTVVGGAIAVLRSVMHT